MVDADSDFGIGRSDYLVHRGNSADGESSPRLRSERSRSGGVSARSAAIAAAATKVDFWISPTYNFEDRSGRSGDWFSGVRVECLGAAIYVHRVVVEEVWAPDPDLNEIEPSRAGIVETGIVEIYPEGDIPELVGLEDTPMLLHEHEYVFLYFPEDKWTESVVATLTVVIDYSFDGKPPVRSRQIEWIGQPGTDFGPFPNADDHDPF